jgi:hypothetical protein
MGRTENSTERLQASRGHRHWAKEIRPSQTLFGVSGEVRSKNNLTESALLEMSGNERQLRRSMQHHRISGPGNTFPRLPTGLALCSVIRTTAAFEAISGLVLNAMWVRVECCIDLLNLPD